MAFFRRIPNNKCKVSEENRKSSLSKHISTVTGKICQRMLKSIGASLRINTIVSKNLHQYIC